VKDYPSRWKSEKIGPMTDISDALWNDSIGPNDYAETHSAAYQAPLLEQYKLCVEMADRVSARRNLANTFFLSLNSAVVVVLAALIGPLAQASAWLLLAGAIILASVSLAWYAMVRSYRLLTGAKFAVVGAMEERLPAYAYSRAEWNELGEGKDWRRYLPLSHIEQWVPLFFVAAYVIGFLALIL
jgi:hypothetical protein